MPDYSGRYNYVYHYKHTLTYGRYMDDIYILSTDKRKLERLLVNITKIANADEITLNTKKTRLIKLSNGITYLKQRYIFDGNRLIIKPNKDTFYRIKRKINKGVVSQNDFNSWYGGLSKYNCHKRLNDMKYYYNKKKYKQMKQ